MQLRPFLTFTGQCQEAIELYQRAFRTKVTELSRFSDLPSGPGSPAVPAEKRDWILQAVLPVGDSYIRLNDCLIDLIDPRSDRLAISVECSVDEVRHAFAVLAEQGEVGIPLQETFFSPCHGVVHDKFGVMWVFVAVAGQQS